MIKNAASRAISTGADTWVDTLVADTSSVSRALRADDTFWPTACGSRVAAGAARTGAHGGLAGHGAQRAWSTWRWCTW